MYSQQTEQSSFNTLAPYLFIKYDIFITDFKKNTKIQYSY